MILTAISPRFAISILFIFITSFLISVVYICYWVLGAWLGFALRPELCALCPVPHAPCHMPLALKWHVPMLSCRYFHPFIIKCIQSRQDFLPSHRRINYFIDISAFISNEWVGNSIAIFFYKLFFKFNRVFRFSKFSSVQNCNSSIGSHNCNFSGRPCKAEIATKVFAVHNNECSTVCLTEYDGYFRNRCFTVGKKQLCSMPNNTCMFLINTRKKPRDIFECNHRYIKSITKPYKSCTFGR